MKKSLLCLCLIFGILLSFSLTVNAKKFDDTVGHWAEGAIDKWSDNGMLGGVGNNNFNPNGFMKRAEAAAVFSRLLKLEQRGNIEDFKDVDLNAWHAEYLEKCVYAGILNGDGANMNPDGYITREMFFVMFCRALGVQPETSLIKEFVDADKISDWAKGYTYALINQGYVNGVAADTIAPKNNINRASAVVLLDRLIANYAVQDNDVLCNTNEGISLVLANNCTVSDGFSGTVILYKEGVKVSFKGASADVKIIIKASNVSVTDIPEGVVVSVAYGAENAKINGKTVEEGTTLSVTVEKTYTVGGGHTHRYVATETTKATCTDDGVMTYACGCGHSYTTSIPKLSATGTHTPGTAVRENEVEGTCLVAGTYDEVVYCSVCNTHEISRTQKTGELGDHNFVGGSCEYCGGSEIITDPTIKISDVVADGTDTVNVELSVINNPGISSLKVFVEYDEKIVLENVSFTSLFGSYVTAPTPYSNPQTINMMSPMEDVTSDGVFATLIFDVSGLSAGDEANVFVTYDQDNTFDSNFNFVTFNVLDGKIIIPDSCVNHIPGTPVKENEVAGNCLTPATYEEVVYCSVCNTHEISRTQKTGELGDHNFVGGSCEHCGETEESTEPRLVVSKATISDTDSTVNITLSIENNPGISSLKIYVECDSALTLSNVAFTQLFGLYVAAPAPYGNPQTINMMSPMSDITGSGEFATLTFNVDT